MCDCINKIRKELPDISPSGGYDEVDEVLGLLRVARMNTQTYHDETLRLRQRIRELEDHVGANLTLDIHACQKCGRPGATMHYPGGYLCSGGCEEVKMSNAEVSDGSEPPQTLNSKPA